MKSGALPVILLTMLGADIGYVLHFQCWMVAPEDGEPVQLCFAGHIPEADFAIIYPPDSNTPIYQSYM